MNKITWFLSICVFSLLISFTSQSAEQAWVYENPDNGTFLNAWLILGPIDAKPYSPDSTDSLSQDDFSEFFHRDPLLNISDTHPDIDLESQIDGQAYRWQLHQSDGAVINLVDIYTKLDYHLAYAYAEIHVDSAGEYGLMVGSDDAGKIWLNGELIYQYWGGRAARLDDFIFVNLQEGKNTLFFEVLNFQVDWGFACRFHTQSGIPTSVLFERNMENVFDTLSDPNQLDVGRLMILIAIVGIFGISIIGLMLYLKLKHRRQHE